MSKKKFSFLFFLFFSICHSQVFINELDSDTPSTDDREFIELKSVTPNFSLSEYCLVFYNGTGSLMNLSYYVIDLDGVTTDINGIAVIGNTLVSPVPAKIHPDNIFQNGPDAIVLYNTASSNFPNNTPVTATNLIDAIVYGTNDADATTLMGVLGVVNQWNESAGTGGSTVNSLQKRSDGTFESRPPTPGANNDGTGFVFNGITISTTATQFNEGQLFTITFTTQTAVTGSALNFNFSLANSGFNATDFTGNLSVTIPVGASSYTATIQLVDDIIDEGDEIAKIRFGTLPQAYNRRNDNIEIRIIDNDFNVAAWGTPLNPTFGVVASTAPSGYYSSLEGKAGTELKQAIQDIIANSEVVRAHNYGDIETILKIADQNPLNSNQVWLMYVEQPRSKLEFQETGINTGKWNREHIYPQSRGGFTDGTISTPDGIDIWLPTNANDILAGHADAHHLRAEDGAENSSRGNRDYGEYLGPANTTGSWRGDVARSLFYMAVRYNGLNIVNGNPANTIVGQLGDLALLLQWNNSDPRDDFEMNRNNYIYTWQVNRNPFIDYPNLADYVFGANFGQTWFSTLSTASFDERKIVIYPNPVKNSFTICGVDRESTLEVFSSQGLKVLETKFNSQDNFTIDVATGIYFAKITTDTKSIVKKIIVQ